jgi:hypothetical protein
VLDAAGLAMHDRAGAHNLSTECGADGLVPQTNTEDRNFACKIPDHIDADARILRRARAG